MIPGKTIGYALLGMSFLISACGDEKGKNDYSGVSKLIAERNKARYETKENSSEKSVIKRKTTTSDKRTSPSKKKSGKDELSSIILYEEDVEIVGAKSQRTLAKGVAYINKKGQIVKIKLSKK